MKNILFMLIALFAISCTNSGVNVTFDDEKSNAIRAHYQNYLNNDIEGLKSLWSPDLKIYMNSVEAAGVEEIASLISAQHENFSDISMSFQDDEGGEDLGNTPPFSTSPPFITVFKDTSRVPVANVFIALSFPQLQL